MTPSTSITLLDGSMGQELVNRGAKWQYGKWAVSALIEQPDLVLEVHEDYLRAGADVITTNTYGTTRTRLRHAGMEDRLAELITSAGELAQQAKKNTGKTQVRVAASLPPLETTYTNTFNLTFDEMVAEYAELMELLDPYVDIFLGETLATSYEARAVLTASKGSDKEVWISWTLHDHGSTLLRGDESIQEGISALATFSVDALLFNCCTPDSIDKALPLLKSAGVPYGAYANGFTGIPDHVNIVDDGVQRLSAREDLTPDHYANHAQTWLSAGASIIGGCCEIGPAHIARLRTLLDGE